MSRSLLVSQLRCLHEPARRPLRIAPRQCIRLASSKAPANKFPDKHTPAREQSSAPEEDDDDDDSVYPNVMRPMYPHDAVFSMGFRSKKGLVSTVNVFNEPEYDLSMYEEDEDVEYRERDEFASEEDEAEAEDEVKDPRQLLWKAVSRDDIIHQYPLLTRRTVLQTPKGKLDRSSILLVVGNGNGLVGYGSGKNDNKETMWRQAYVEAVRNMDYVDRFEKRTIWTPMEIKSGATRVHMRPRPVGFGLRCNPYMHQVLKAAGIKDISAKVWGSRNPYNVVKATCQLIQSGHAPLSMGNGIGGKGRRVEAGYGMRGKESLERERGRKFIDDRTW